MDRDNAQSLITIPADDCNFKAALGYADMGELERAAEMLDLQFQGGFKVKSRLAAVQREIRKRKKGGENGGD